MPFRLHFKSCTWIVILEVFFASLPASAQFQVPQEQAPQKITLHEFLQNVAKNHPDRGIDLLELKKAKLATEKLGRLNDPNLSVGRERTPFGARFQLESMQEDLEKSKMAAAWTLTATQTFPWPGALYAGQHAAQKNEDVVRTRINSAHAFYVFEAKEIFLNLVTKSRLVEVEKENLAEADRILKTARSRLSFGVGSQSEALAAQNEKTLLGLNIDSLLADLENLSSYAKQLMGVSLNVPVQFELDTNNKPLVAIHDDHAVLAIAGLEKEDSSKRQIEAGVAAETARFEAERRQSLPEFMTSVMVMREDSGMRMYGAMLGVRVPLYSGGLRNAISTEADVANEKAQKKIAWYEQRKNLALVQSEVRTKTLKKNFEILKSEIIPTARQHLSVTLSEYSKGKGSIGSVTTSRKTLLKYQSAQVNIENEMALAELAKERIEAGFVDAELNPRVLQLSSSGMNEDPMGTTEKMPPGTSNKSGQSENKPTRTPKATNGAADDTSLPAEESKSGMGM